MADKWIRVRATSGHHISVRGDLPAGHPRGIQDGQEQLDQPAVDASGEPLPPTYRTDLGEGPAPSTRNRSLARTSAEATPQGPVPAAADAQPEATTGQQADTERQD